MGEGGGKKEGKVGREEGKEGGGEGGKREREEGEEGGGIGRKGNGEGEGGNGRNMEEVSCKQREIGSEENDKQNRKTERKEPKYKS